MDAQVDLLCVVDKSLLPDVESTSYAVELHELYKACLIRAGFIRASPPARM